jgi:hypothetical protein
MPAVPGATHYVTSYVSGWTSSNVKLGNDFSLATTTVIVIDNTSPLAAYNLTTSKTSAGGIKLNYWVQTDTDMAATVVLRSTSPITTEKPTEGSTYTEGNAIGAATVTCVNTAAISPYSENSCLYSSPNRSTKYYFAVFIKDTAGNYSQIAATSDFIILPSPAGRMTTYLEAEITNGATATTTGATSQGGGTSTSSSTNATTTTSTSTPNQGGGSGDVGLIYQGSNLAVQKESSFLGAITSVFGRFLMGDAGISQAKEVKAVQANTCGFTFYGICIAKTVPWAK